MMLYFNVTLVLIVKLKWFFSPPLQYPIVKKKEDQYLIGTLSWLSFKAMSIVITEKAYL